MPNSPNSYRDPYELERLANELATRESGNPKEAAHELPTYIPLAHDNKYLAVEQFSVEEFLLSRSYTSLPDLRLELRDYLAQLKEELVKLINDDYEAFISLSTDLRDEGERLERINNPLNDIKNEVLKSKRELQVIQSAIQEKLENRAILREQQTLLHLLLKISESVTRLESLLLITSSEQTGSALAGSRIPVHLNSGDDIPDDKSRGNKAKHLGRVAAEYTQLLYHVSKAKSEKCVFVQEVQWRVDRIRSTLSSDLDQLFSTTLLAFIESKGENKATELERAKWMTDLTECLRTYDLLSLWRDAEDVLRRETVRRFVKKTIYPGALAAPYSPIVPNTPFRPSPLPVPETPLTAIYPNTPYTPFMSKSPYSLQSSGVTHFLEDHDNQLAKLYNQILRFLERDLRRIMDIAEKVSVKSTVRGSEGLLGSSENGNEEGNEPKGFQIMANVVWEEVGRAIMDEVGSVVFAAGQPNEFRKHYETTQSFIKSLELMASSKQSVAVMRTHPLFVTFERRWQLPVYFQLRWKEIIGKLEDTLSSTQLESTSTREKGSFASSQASAVWTAILSCWSSEVYIPDLCPRFWRLTLQILSRFKLWLDDWLSLTDHIPRGIIDNASISMPRSSTPTPSSEISPENTAADDAALRQYAAVLTDLSVLKSNMTSFWENQLSDMVPSADSLSGAAPAGALDRILTNLWSLVPPISSQVITILTRRCCDVLQPVRSIPSQFRAMSNKRNPTEPSHFLPSVLRPLKQFFGIGIGDGPGAPLKDSFLETFSLEIFTHVTQRYISHLTAMKKTEDSLKRLKKGKKSTFSLFGNTNKDDEGRDEERIRNQMILDVEAFGREAQSLGVALEGNESYRNLVDMVHAEELS